MKMPRTDTFPAGLVIMVLSGCCVVQTQVRLQADERAGPVVVVSGPLRLEEHLIMDKYAYPYGIAAADLDGDGDLDLTSADALPHNSLYWFENDGKGRFKRHFIQTDDPERLERHGVGDVDRDGHPDVVIVKNLRGDLLWFKNSGNPRDGELWKRHVITKGELPGAYDVALADLDDDGDLDVAASAWRLGNQFAWFENDGSPADGPWKKHLIEADLAETRAILAADIDRDGDIDLVGTATAARLVLWYENPGQPAKESWTRHVIDDKSHRPMHGRVIDMDGDGDLDLLMALGMHGGQDVGPETGHQVVWYENDGTPGKDVWRMHVIGRPLANAIDAGSADLDGDGDLDVVAAAWAEPGQVVWFENGGDPKGRWTMHMIKDNWKRADQVITADLDGDGKVDIAAAAERGTLEFRWWRNLGWKPK